LTNKENTHVYKRLLFLDGEISPSLSSDVAAKSKQIKIINNKQLDKLLDI
jgi:hypothetical protein